MSEGKAREFWIEEGPRILNVSKANNFETLNTRRVINVIEKSAYDKLQKENEELNHEILELKEDLGFTKSQLKRAWKSIRTHVSRRRFYRKENEALKAKLDRSMTYLEFATLENRSQREAEFNLKDLEAGE